MKHRDTSYRVCHIVLDWTVPKRVCAKYRILLVYLQEPDRESAEGQREPEDADGGPIQGQGPQG